MANTVQIRLLENKTAQALWNGRPIEYEGGYRIIAGEVNATKFELTSVPKEYELEEFTITGYNAGKKAVQLDPINQGETFTLPVGMAVAGYSSLVFSCNYKEETVYWLPIKLKVYNTDPDWVANSIDISDSKLIELQNQINGLDEKIEHLEIPDATATVKGKATLGSEGGAAKYEDVEKLKEQLGDLTYKAPTTSFSLTGNTTAVDLTSDNTTRIITGFSHHETNIENIQGTLQFKYNTTTKTVNKSATSSSETLSPSITVTFSSSLKSAKFTLSGMSIKNVAFSSSQSITAYYPSFYGASANPPTTTTISTLSKGSESLRGSLATILMQEDNKYIWFCTTGIITRITSNGFEVPFTNAGTLNYKGATYKLYRTSNLITRGTHTFSIS